MTSRKDDIFGCDARREIVILLRDRELAAGDVCRALQLSPAGVSDHLSRLSFAGLLLTRRVGRFRYYRVDPKRALEEWDQHIRKQESLFA